MENSQSAVVNKSVSNAVTSVEQTDTKQRKKRTPRGPQPINESVRLGKNGLNAVYNLLHNTQEDNGLSRGDYLRTQADLEDVKTNLQKIQVVVTRLENLLKLAEKK